MKAMKWIGQGLTWAALAAAVGGLAQGPRFAPYEDDTALLVLSMAHLSERLTPCRELSAAERAELPPTRRVQEVCERGRAPTRVMLELDGRTLLSETVQPAGLSDDGRSYLMKRLPVTPGRHELRVRVFDTPEPAAPAHERRFEARLDAGSVTLMAVGDDGISLSRPEQAEAP